MKPGKASLYLVQLIWVAFWNRRTPVRGDDLRHKCEEMDDLRQKCEERVNLGALDKRHKRGGMKQKIGKELCVRDGI